MDTKRIREIIKESIEEYFKEHSFLSEDNLEEERITNVEARDKVKSRENFVGSHTFGEDIGGLGQMYVAFSYGKDHPLYMWDGTKWYKNSEDYINDDGEVNSWSHKHLEDLNPGNAEDKPKKWMVDKLNSFMSKNGIKELSHSDVDPGEK